MTLVKEIRWDPENLVLDEGYYFGLGLFETIAVEEGWPLFWDRHLARLQKGLDFLGLHQTITREEVQAYIRTWPIEIQQHGVLKITISEKNVLLTHRTNPYQSTDYERGFSCALSSVYRNPTSPFVYHKTLQYGELMQELRRAKARGYDGAVFQNFSQHFCEESRSNLFFIQGERIVTPSLANGLLNGTVRQLLLDRLTSSKQSQGLGRPFSLEEGDIPVDELPNFDEAFLTNALMGVMPICQLGDHVFKRREKVGHIRHLYLSLVKEELAKNERDFCGDLE